MDGLKGQMILRMGQAKNKRERGFPYLDSLNPLRWTAEAEWHRRKGYCTADMHEIGAFRTAVFGYGFL